MPENLYPKILSAPLMSQESFNMKQLGNIIQTLRILRTSIMKANGKYKNAYTVVGIPISASLGVVSTVSACVGASLLLTS